MVRQAVVPTERKISRLRDAETPEDVGACMDRLAATDYFSGVVRLARNRPFASSSLPPTSSRRSPPNSARTRQ